MVASDKELDHEISKLLARKIVSQESVVDFAYGQQYSRPGLELKSRYIATIAALTALGGQTSPQLKVNIEGALKAGLSKHEIGEVIWQMSLYGGFPAAINALNAVLEIFEEYP